MTKTTKQYRTANSIIENIRKRLLSEQLALSGHLDEVRNTRARIEFINAILEDSEKGQPKEDQND